MRIQYAYFIIVYFSLVYCLHIMRCIVVPTYSNKHARVRRICIMVYKCANNNNVLPPVISVCVL